MTLVAKTIRSFRLALDVVFRVPPRLAWRTRGPLSARPALRGRGSLGPRRPLRLGPLRLRLPSELGPLRLRFFAGFWQLATLAT